MHADGVNQIRLHMFIGETEICLYGKELHKMR